MPVDIPYEQRLRLRFPVYGSKVPVDHAEPLYAAEGEMKMSEKKCLVTYGTIHGGTLFWVSEEDWNRVREHHWYLAKNGYIWTKIDRKTVYLHRFVMDAGPEQEVDHVNRNKLDNTRDNLRFVNHSQNAVNKIINNPYGRGATRLKSGRYRAHIGCQGKDYNIGCYDNAADAAKAYEAYAWVLFGEYHPQI